MLAAMPFARSLPVRVLLASALGLGFAAANTVANMFIVEVWPREEWDGRIGALQACNGAGQVAGLLVAGFFGSSFLLAFGVAAALVATAVPIAWRTLRSLQLGTKPGVPRNTVAAHPALGAEGWAGNPSRHFHRPTLEGLRRVLGEAEMPFVQVLLLWFVAFTALTSVLTLFPLAMRQTFGEPQHVLGSTYALAAAAGLPIYGVASAIARKRGSHLSCVSAFRSAWWR